VKCDICRIAVVGTVFVKVFLGVFDGVFVGVFVGRAIFGTRSTVARFQSLARMRIVEVAGAVIYETAVIYEFEGNRNWFIRCLECL
jgi:MFS superfamily sulfate permease-like transporter